MKRIFFLLLLYFSSYFCFFSSAKINVLPYPQKVTVHKGICKLTNKSEIVFYDDQIKDIAQSLSHDFNNLCGFKMNLVKNSSNSFSPNIQLSIDSTLSNETYSLDIADNIKLRASNYQTLALATSTLVQLCEIENNTLKFQKVNIYDYPFFEWRSVMVDLARKWHPYECLKQIVDYLHFYKVKYLHLHLSDDQMFVFGSEAFPMVCSMTEKGERRYYTKKEFKELVQYAKTRGVIIIPEIDVPGHSMNLWKKCPSVFGYVNPETNKVQGLSAVNMTKESCYAGMDILISELVEVFSTSPYIHLGGDEVSMANIVKLPDYKPFCLKHNLRVNAPNDLYLYFLIEMNKIVNKYGKKSILWESFQNNGVKGLEIPNDIKVISWNTAYNSPTNLFKYGYDVIHSTWFPFYMCGGMTFAPSQEMGYNWDYRDYKHWQPAIKDLRLTEDKKVEGAQISFWEQNYDWTLSILENRLPAFATRWWNYQDKTPFKSFYKDYEGVSAKIDRILHPVLFEVKGLTYSNDIVFQKDLEIAMKSSLKGHIKYFTSKYDWYLTPKQWINYEEPLTINESQIVTAALFDDENKMIGNPRQMRYYKIKPIIKYTCYGNSPTKGWNEMPRFDTLPVIRKGLFGVADSARLSDINRIYFRKYNEHGFIDTRPYQLTNTFALEMDTKVNIPVSGEYKFVVELSRANIEFYFGKGLSASSEKGKDKSTFSIELKKGLIPLKMKYYNQNIGNRLNVRVILPNTDKEIPLTDLMVMP